MNPSSNKIEDILKQNYIEDSPWHTHVSMIQPRGKFLFNRKNLEEFWDIYCEKIYDNPDIIVGVAEKSKEYLPVLVDVDIKVLACETDLALDHLYTEEQVYQLVQIYQSVLRNIVEDIEEDNLMCVLLEKEIYYFDAGDISYAKNGFHLHFPKLFLPKEKQEVHLIPRVQETLDKMKLFENLGFEKSGQAIDKAVCQVPWLLYGSRKSEEMHPYKVTKIFNSSLEEISLDKAFSNYIIYNNKEKPINIRGQIEKYLPRILSIDSYNRPVSEFKNGLACPQKQKINNNKKKEKTNLKISVKEALETAEKLLPMIADWRAEERNEWMTIGWILYNIGDGSTQALDLWLEFSQRCDEKYDESMCIYEWERMTKKDYTLGTLLFYASKDSPQKFEEYKKQQREEHIKESLNGSHNDIAKILYSDFGENFTCASIAGKTWYQFKNHRWEDIEEGTYLRELISGPIVEHYISMSKDYYDKLNTRDKAEEAMINARLKLINKKISDCKSAPFKNNVMKEAMEVFYDRRFKDKLDQNPYLIGFKNGVYDLKQNIFRDGQPEDFISKLLPIKYQEYKIQDEEVQNVLSFLQKVFPDEDLRTYFLDTYSDIFVGGNNFKKFYVWTGDGDNGKSITQLLFDKMLGELAIKMNTQYFTGKKVSSGSANPELIRAAPPVRLVTMEEPDGDETLNVGELKKLSGGDSFWARDLFEKGKSSKEYFPMFMMQLICNKLPKLKYSDKATWNRMCVIPFESTFVDGVNCPETLEEQIKEKRFPMDKELKYKIPEMVPAFAWFLLDWRTKITVRKIPSKVQQATAEYRRQNDIFRQFIEENIMEDSVSKISISELYACFKEWYKEGWPSGYLPIKNEVKEYFDSVWGEAERNTNWTGYRIRTEKDLIEAGELVELDDSDLINYDEEDEDKNENKQKNIPDI